MNIPRRPDIPKINNAHARGLAFYHQVPDNGNKYDTHPPVKVRLKRRKYEEQEHRQGYRQYDSAGTAKCRNPDCFLPFPFKAEHMGGEN